ncbi:MAG: amidohydrolase family protein [Acidimicrobiales bacterium]|nr:amidohydrolase family protein [Acidimicrobiales bacterium]
MRPSPDAAVIDGGGGALIPGLHDHHIHLLATAAAARSVVAGPPEVRDERALAAALRRADAALAPGAWIRAVGYHESVAGDIDRHDLDRLVPRRPVRVQHRSGARWVLNSVAVDSLGLDHQDHHADRSGIERDAAGRTTGRLHRADDWLRHLLPREDPPDLAALGRRLARFGVTAVTDTTPYTTFEDLAPLTDAVASGALPQHVVVTGGPELAGSDPPAGLSWGPVKIVIDDGAYPSLDDLCDRFTAAHRHGRRVAVHCVTRVALVLALAAWDEAGSRPGDRIEHGAVIPDDQYDRIARHGLTVVTQPGFVAERGDDHLRDVDPDDRPHLYPCASLIDRGIAVAGSTDAPYTHLDPWRAVDAARTRTTATGATVGAREAVGARRALDLFLGSADAPGGPPRSVTAGSPADLCLLTVPLDDALRNPREVRVAATVVDGRIVR